MNEPKKVSIIIPNYNKAKYIEETILSALNQTYKNLEIVIYDDTSTDNSVEIIKKYVSKYNNIVFIEGNTNKGVVYARNKAIEVSTGEYILPLDSDDKIEPTYIEKAAEILDKNPNIGIVYCKARLFGRTNENWELPEFDKNKILYENCIFCSALFRKADFIRAGKYKDNMIYGIEDYDLWLSFIELGLDAYRIDEILFNYRLCNEDTMSTIALENQHKTWQLLVKNHIDLYIESKDFVDKLMCADIEKFKKQTIDLKKYRLRFKTYRTIMIIEAVIILVGIVLFLL